MEHEHIDSQVRYCVLRLVRVDQAQQCTVEEFNGWYENMQHSLTTSAGGLNLLDHLEVSGVECKRPPSSRDVCVRTISVAKKAKCWS